jgi:hypothetical protein
VFPRVILPLWFCPGCRNISVDPLTTELVVDRRWTHGRHRRGRAWWGGLNTLCTDRDFCGSLRSVYQQHAVAYIQRAQGGRPGSTRDAVRLGVQLNSLSRRRSGSSRAYLNCYEATARPVSLNAQSSMLER